jgi:hypothetical protein
LKASKVVLGVALGLALFCLFSLVISLTGESAAPEIMARVPIGSDLDRLYLSVGKDRRAKPGDVMLWIPSSAKNPDFSDYQPRRHGVTIRTDFGMFRQKNLGNYSDWSPTEELRTRFTGDIDFFVDNGQAETRALTFTYMNGKLVSKDWGFLPG